MSKQTKDFGDYRVTEYEKFSGISRSVRDADREKAKKTGRPPLLGEGGRILVEECKTFAGACRLAKSFDEIEHPEKNPKKFALATKLADLTNKAAGGEVCKPALFMTWGEAQMNREIERITGATK